MARIINVNVVGNHLTRDNNTAGVRGEGKSTILRITFDESWDEHIKKVTFRNARGENPVTEILGMPISYDENGVGRTYDVPIPYEPLEVAGSLTFIIDGLWNGQRQRSVECKLAVIDAPDVVVADIGRDEHPDELDQLQIKIEEIKENILQAYYWRDETRVFKDMTEQYMESAEAYKSEAQNYAKYAQDSVGKTSYIGENGNWYAWDGSTMRFYDTGVRAQAGSTVYMGDNPPDDADVWIQPDELGGLDAIKLVIKDDIDKLNNREDAGVYRLVSMINRDDSAYVDMAEFLVVSFDKFSSPQMRQYLFSNGLKFRTSEREGIYGGVWSEWKDVGAVTAPTYAYVNIQGGESNWVSEEIKDASGNAIGTRYGQVVNVNNAVITPNSKVDLQLSSEQMAIFYEKDLAFVAENENGVVTIYCIGQIPQNDYTIQATVTEVVING